MKSSVKNRCVFRFVSLALAVFAVCDAAANLWFRPNDGFTWSAPTNWLDGSSMPVNRLPGTNDTVSLNSRLTSTQDGQALTVTAGTDAVCGWLRMHDQTANPQTNIWVRVETGASLTCAGWGEDDFAGLNVGMSDAALLSLDGGALYATNVVIGYAAAGSGVVSNNGGRMDVRWMNVGNSGMGRLDNNGTVKVGDSVVIGRKQAATGVFTISGGKTTVGNYLLVGHAGNGELFANAGFSTRYLVVGCSSNGVGVATLAGSGATGSVSEACYVGGRHLSDEETGSGVLALKGGSLRFSTTPYTLPNLFVRAQKNAAGQLRGWGTVMGAYSGATNVRMANDGTVVADGEGVERDLDLHEVVSTTNRFENGTNGTNGWQAVNKGRLLYPRTWFNVASATRCLGDVSNKTAPEMVNSLCATFTGVTGAFGKYFRGGLYATDRGDIPGGLPSSQSLVAVWGLGLYASLTDNTTASFDTVSLTFRYDHTRVKETDTLHLYRYENNVWKRVGTCRPDSTRLISTEAPLSRLTTGDYNIGWFALMAGEFKGTVITVL